MKVIFFESAEYDRHSFDSLENKEHEFTYVGDILSMDNVNLAEGFDAICSFVNSKGTKEVLDKIASFGIKLWLQRSAGFNNVDLDAAKANKITVMRVPSYSPEGVAEFAMTLLMAVNRNIHLAVSKTKIKDFSLDGLEGETISGQTIGVMGAGKIGQSFIQIARGLGAKLLVFDEWASQNRPELATEMGFTFASQDEIFKESNYISLHLPLNDNTRFIVNKTTLSMMKPNGIIINTARGELINTTDLLDYLDDGRLRGAGLDVYEKEQGIFFYNKSNTLIPDLNLSRLRAHRNVILTSHQAFFTRLALSQIASVTLDNINGFLKGELEGNPNIV